MSHGSGKLLAYRNNWEADEFSVVDQTHDGKRLGSTLIIDLRKVRIDFTTYDVTSREVSVPYDDMGRQYTATSKHYFVKERVFGGETVRSTSPVLILRNKHEPTKKYFGERLKQWLG
jgi:hypothetical protein